MGFDYIHFALAEQLLRIIHNDGENAIITYGDLCNRVNNIVHPRSCAPFLGDLSVLCYENGMPLISVMVVNGDTFMPGNGFFELYHDLTGKQVIDKQEVFIKELTKVTQYQGWSKLAELLGLSISI